MSKQEALAVLNGGHLEELNSAVRSAIASVTAAKEVEVVLGSFIDVENLLNTYKMRHRRLVDMGKPVPEGLSETVLSFESRSGQLETSYIKSDERLVYFWRDDSDLIVGCIAF